MPLKPTLAFSIINYVHFGAKLTLDQTNPNEKDHVSASNELVIINFYADWCKFSNILQPIFDEAADKVKVEFTEPGRIVFGKVDCDQESKYSFDFIRPIDP